MSYWDKIYKGKFFIKPTNSSIEFGNLCYINKIETAYGSYNYDFIVDMYNVRYDKRTLELYKNFHGSNVINHEKRKLYTNTTFSRITFMTADELFKKHETLMLNIYNFLCSDNSYYVRTAQSKILKNAMLQSEMLNTHIEANKYNL